MGFDRSTWGTRLAAALLVTGLAGLGSSGCAHSSQTEVLPPSEVLPGEFAGAPEWVTQGCARYWGDEGARMCAVGSMGGTRNVSLARAGAVGRGRTEIARALETRVKAMLKDYQANTTGGEEFLTAAADEQHIVDAARQITDASLSGTEMQDTWLSGSGTLYALVALDLERFEDAVARMEQLDERVRQAVIERADEAFRELDEQIDRERGDWRESD